MSGYALRKRCAAQKFCKNENDSRAGSSRQGPASPKECQSCNNFAHPGCALTAGRDGVGGFFYICYHCYKTSKTPRHTSRKPQSTLSSSEAENGMYTLPTPGQDTRDVTFSARNRHESYMRRDAHHSMKEQYRDRLDGRAKEGEQRRGQKELYFKEGQRRQIRPRPTEYDPSCPIVRGRGTRSGRRTKQVTARGGRGDVRPLPPRSSLANSSSQIKDLERNNENSEQLCTTIPPRMRSAVIRVLNLMRSATRK